MNAEVYQSIRQGSSLNWELLGFEISLMFQFGMGNHLWDNYNAMCVLIGEITMPDEGVIRADVCIPSLTFVFTHEFFISEMYILFPCNSA